MRDLLMAAKSDNDLLRKIVCARCGKTVWVNRETKYCFDCEAKIQAQVTTKSTE